MSILIRNATILAMDNLHGSTPFTGDVLIEGDSIRQLGTGLTAPEGATLIDGTGKLVMPGLINSHLHSGEALFKGRYDNMPLELWMLYSYPVLGTSSIDDRIIYLRSMLVAIEALKTGTTCITDDLFESPAQTLGQLNAAVQAYDDIGIRATVSGHMIDRPYMDTIPFSREFLPAECQTRLEQMTPPSAEDFIDFAKAAYREFHDRSGRIRFMVAPSAPQRCSDTLLQAADELARQWQVHPLPAAGYRSSAGAPRAGASASWSRPRRPSAAPIPCCRQRMNWPGSGRCRCIPTSSRPRCRAAPARPTTARR